MERAHRRFVGQTPGHAEWLNTTDVWPNQSFAESLRKAIGDEGPVLTWTHFEGTTLKQIIADLTSFEREAPDLVRWMTDVFERRIVDLHDWAGVTTTIRGCGDARRSRSCSRRSGRAIP